MARLLYGCTAADYTTTGSGQIIPSATVTVWDSEVAGAQITDLLDSDSQATTAPASNAYGQVRFYAPDGENRALWAQTPPDPTT